MRRSHRPASRKNGPHSHKKTNQSLRRSAIMFASVGAPPPAPPLTCVRVALRHDRTVARAQVAALPHVVAAISDFLDHALPTIWSLPQACEANLVSLLPRLAARRISDGIDTFYWTYQCRQGLVYAVKHDNLAMVEWLHECCPSVLPYLPIVEGARTGNLRMLQWLTERHESVVWLPHMMDAAASMGHLHVLQWLHEHPKNAGCTSDAFGSAVRGGYCDTVKRLLDHCPSAAVFSVQLVNGTIWFVEKGDLAMVQWLYAKAKELGLMSNDKLVGRLVKSAADHGHLHVV